MSKIIKKITKKYKWLRFLNYKTTKLAVLSAALFGLCLSSGASFAKYKDENYGGGNAGTATFGDVIVSYIENDEITTIKLPTEGGASNAGWYAFIATFKVQVFPSEVKREIILSVKLGGINDESFDSASTPTDTFFALPADSYLAENKTDNASKIEQEKVQKSFATSYLSTFGLNPATNTITKMTISDVKSKKVNRWQFFGSYTEIFKERVYYGIWETTDLSVLSYDDKANYTWYDNVYNSTKGALKVSKDYIDFPTAIVTPSEVNGKVFFIKILFFSNFEVDTSSQKFKIESSKIFYNITTRQVS